MIVRCAGGTVTSAELIARGVRWEDLHRLRDLGVLVEISRGVYRIVDAPATAHLDLVAMCRGALRTRPGLLVDRLQRDALEAWPLSW